MAGFLYFAAGRPRVDQAWLESHGPAHAFEPDDLGRLSQAEVGQGPGDQRGVLFTRTAGEPQPMGYAPGVQKWAKAVGGDWWLGCETDAPPTPADLLRAEAIDGHLVRLGDGQKWLVPVARMVAGGSTLPQAIVLGPKGEKIGRALPRYVALGRHGERVAVDLRIKMGVDAAPDGYEPVSVSEGWDIAVEALGINYRLGPDEVSLLELITTQNMVPILEALVDMPTLRAVTAERLAAAAKKKASDIPDGSNTASGVRDA